MRKVWTLMLPAAVAAVFSTSPLYAQNTKSFVASTGNDANTCATEAAPCRTINGAHGKTNANGIIYCLDNGEFAGGPTTTITKSITIDCAGTGGSIRATAIAVIVNAAATDIIHLRGLKLNTAPGGILIQMESTGKAGSVRIEDCDIIGVPGNPAIVVGGGPVPSTNVIELLVARTTITGGSNGILVQPDGGGAKVTLDDVRIFNSGTGINLQGTGATTAPNLRVAVKNSTITGNTNQGIRAVSTNGATRVFVKDTMVAQNATGIQADGAQALIHVSGSTITHNGTGLSAVNGGLLVSFGNNDVSGQVTSNGAFTTTVAQK